MTGAISFYLLFVGDVPDSVVALLLKLRWINGVWEDLGLGSGACEPDARLVSHLLAWNSGALLVKHCIDILGGRLDNGLNSYGLWNSWLEAWVSFCGSFSFSLCSSFEHHPNVVVCHKSIHEMERVPVMNHSRLDCKK